MNQGKIKKIRNKIHTERIMLGDIIIMAIIAILSLSCILPFFHIAAKSLSSNSAVLSKEVYLLPKGFNFAAYRSIFLDGQMTRAMWYTVMMTLIFTSLGLVVTICAAYPLTKARLKGRTFFAFMFMFTMLFGAGLIPEYLLMKNLNLLNNMWVLILPVAFSPFNLMIMRTYILGNIPDSLEESAFLDGATDFQILFRIVLPLSKPILATLALFYAVGRWNGYADARYYITDRSLQPLQLILSNMVLASGSDAVSLSENAEVVSTPEVYQSAAVMFASLPIICVYPFVQKYFVKGALVGAVKG